MKPRHTAILFIILTGLLYTSAKAQVCTVDGRHLSVLQWNSTKGALEKYVSRVIDTSSLGFLIFLGQDSLGIYTIEGGLEDDARGGEYANLVCTGFDGQRSTQNIYTGDMLEPYLETKSLGPQKKAILSKKLAAFRENGSIPQNLQPITYWKSPTTGHVAVNTTANTRLTWFIQTRSTMCWCHYNWALSVKNN